jgi:hypothetical protein
VKLLILIPAGIVAGGLAWVIAHEIAVLVTKIGAK